MLAPAWRKNVSASLGKVAFALKVKYHRYRSWQTRRDDQ